MARLYSNENFPLPAVEVLRTLEHDVLTSLESDNAGRAIPDDEVLAFAVADKRALITLNRKHFIRLHGQQPNHFGIIVCTFDPDFRALAQRIHEAVSTEDTLVGKLLRIHRPLAN